MRKSGACFATSHCLHVRTWQRGPPKQLPVRSELLCSPQIHSIRLLSLSSPEAGWLPVTGKLSLQSSARL